MAEILRAILLGIIQGLTEFLPVSSSGHLILFEKLGLAEPSLTLNIMLHIGTLFAVIIVYRKQLWQLLRRPFSKASLLYVLACIPTGIIALIMKKYLYGWIMGDMLPFGFLVTAVLLAAVDLCRIDKNTPLNAKNALLTGVMQGIAVLPGISRSGATVSALMLSGVKREEAAEFSFILSVPVIILSAVSELWGESVTFKSVFTLPTICGMLAAFAFGLFSIRFMIKLIKTKQFWPFSVYLAVLAVVCFFILY